MGDYSTLISRQHLRKSVSCWWPGPQEQPSGGGGGGEESSPVIPPPPSPALLFIPLSRALSFFGQCHRPGSLWMPCHCTSLPGTEEQSKATHEVGLPPVL